MPSSNSTSHSTPSPSTPSPTTPSGPATPAPGSADFEHLRTERNQVLPHYGAQTQQRLANARVCVIGSGGLGSPLLLGLAAAGVAAGPRGQLILCEDDTVDATNLNRQVLYTSADIGAPKAALAAARLRALCPTLTVIPAGRFSTERAEELLRPEGTPVDLFIDASDNFATRYAASDAAAAQQVPLLWGSVLQYAGQLALFTPGSDFLRGLYPQPPTNPPNNADAGVLGSAAHTIGTLMGAEAIKFLGGLPGTSLAGRLLTYDVLSHRSRLLTIG